MDDKKHSTKEECYAMTHSRVMEKPDSELSAYEKYVKSNVGVYSKFLHCDCTIEEISTPHRSHSICENPKIHARKGGRALPE